MTTSGVLEEAIENCSQNTQEEVASELEKIIE